MSDIFISYKSEDRPKAKIIAEALEENGNSVWWDRLIPPGKTFDQVIVEALSAAKCVIVLWSRESVSSDWVKNEAREGSQRHILVPILIEDVNIPFEFKHIQAARLVDWQGELPNPEFDLLLNSVAEIVGRLPTQKMEIKKKTLTSTTPPQPTRPSFRFLTYDNFFYHIRIKYPSVWTKSEEIIGTIVAFLSPQESSSDSFRENLNVYIGNLSQSMTLDDYIDLSNNQLKQLITDYSIIDSSATTLAGNPAHKVIFTGKQGGFNLKWMQVYMIKNNRDYVISYTAEEDKYSYFLGTIQEMINSFEILGNL